MRIDIDAISYRPDYVQQKTSGDNNELNNRGENVRGRVIDVNQNIVLIQTSTGKQFSATTVVPMENFIDQDVSFAVLVGPDGELILSPEIDENKQNNLEQLKLQDILTKLGKGVTTENKEILKEMMKSSIPITKENFEQIKDLKFALTLLQSEDFSVEISDSDMEQNIGDVIKDIQTKKDFGVDKKVDSPIIGKDSSLKDLLLLKNLDMKISPKNINALSDMLEKLNTNKQDLVGINNLVNSKNINEVIKNDVMNLKYSQIELPEENKDMFSSILYKADELTAEDMDKFNKNIKAPLFKSFDDDINILEKSYKNIEQKTEKINSENILNMLKNIEKNVNKKINDISSNRREELKIDYEQTKNEIKNIIQNLGKESDLSKTIEKQISPKIDILSNMLEKYNYTIIPFKTEKDYENTLQYYVKKDKKNLKKQDEINIGLALDTRNYGNVKTMVNYNKNSSIKLDFFTENKKTKNVFENNIKELKSILKSLGFNNIDTKISIREKNTTLMQDAIYNENASKSYEFYV